MISLHTHVALKYVADDRPPKAARPKAEVPVREPGLLRRSLVRLHLTPARQSLSA